VSETADGAAEAGSGERRRALVSRVERLASELSTAEAELLALGGEPLPGLHLAVEAAGQRAVLPAGRIREVVPLLATAPVPGAPPAVLGTFLLRGAPVTVLDVSRVLGVEREPALEAQIVVLGGARAVGLLVDRVLAVLDRAVLVEGPPPAAEEGAFERARLVAGLCRFGDALLPLLHVGALLRALEAGP
jgi:purine-binding chemotaxis protein CheW